jgi:hypothetical protein
MDTMTLIYLAVILLCAAGIIGLKIYAKKANVNVDSEVDTLEEIQGDAISNLQGRLVLTQSQTHPSIPSQEGTKKTVTNIIKMPTPASNDSDKIAEIKEDEENEDIDHRSNAALRE